MKLALKCSIKKSTNFVQIQRNFGNFTHHWDGQKGKIKQKLQIFLLIANLWASSIFWWSVSMNQGTLVRQSNAKKLLPLKPILALPTLGQIWSYMALDCSSSLLGKNWEHWLAWAIELILGNKEFDWGSRWDQIGFIDYVLRLSKRATLKSKPKIKVNFFWKQWKYQSTNLQLLAIWKHGFVRHCQIFQRWFREIIGLSFDTFGRIWVRW